MFGVLLKYLVELVKSVEDHENEIIMNYLVPLEPVLGDPDTVYKVILDFCRGIAGI